MAGAARAHSVQASEPDRSTEAIRQEAALKSVGKHMASLKSITYWALSTVGIVFLFAVSPGPEIDFLGAKIDRQSAVVVISIAYVVVLLDVSILLNNIRDLLQILTGDHAKKAVYEIVYDDWAMNPFAYFTNTTGSLWWSWIGFGLSLLTVFLSCGSIVVLEQDHGSRRFILMIVLIIASAIYAGVIAGRVFEHIGRQIETLKIRRLWEYVNYLIYLIATYMIASIIAVGLVYLCSSIANGRLRPQPRLRDQ